MDGLTKISWIRLIRRWRPSTTHSVLASMKSFAGAWITVLLNLKAAVARDYGIFRHLVALRRRDRTAHNRHRLGIMRGEAAPAPTCVPLDPHRTVATGKVRARRRAGLCNLRLFTRKLWPGARKLWGTPMNLHTFQPNGNEPPTVLGSCASCTSALILYWKYQIMP